MFIPIYIDCGSYEVFGPYRHVHDVRCVYQKPRLSCCNVKRNFDWWISELLVLRNLSAGTVAFTIDNASRCVSGDAPTTCSSRPLHSVRESKASFAIRCEKEEEEQEENVV
jgi:hypothetical protein